MHSYLFVLYPPLIFVIVHQTTSMILSIVRSVSSIVHVLLKTNVTHASMVILSLKINVLNARRHLVLFMDNVLDVAQDNQVHCFLVLTVFQLPTDIHFYLLEDASSVKVALKLIKMGFARSAEQAIFPRITYVRLVIRAVVLV